MILPPALPVQEMLTDRLWRCDLASAVEDNVITSRRIDVLVSLMTAQQWERRGLMAWNPDPVPDQWLRAEVQDGVSPDFPASRWREVITTIVDAIENGHRTLVHCTAGRSRSGVACAVSLAVLDDAPVQQVIDDLRSRGMWRGINPVLLTRVAQVMGVGV